MEVEGNNNGPINEADIERFQAGLKERRERARVSARRVRKLISSLPTMDYLLDQTREMLNRKILEYTGIDYQLSNNWHMILVVVAFMYFFGAFWVVFFTFSKYNCNPGTYSYIGSATVNGNIYRLLSVVYCGETCMSQVNGDNIPCAIDTKPDYKFVTQDEQCKVYHAHNNFPKCDAGATLLYCNAEILYCKTFQELVVNSLSATVASDLLILLSFFVLRLLYKHVFQPVLVKCFPHWYTPVEVAEPNQGIEMLAPAPVVDVEHAV